MTRLIGLLMLLSLGLNAQANSNSCKELFILTSPEGAVQELLGTLPPRGLKSEIMKEGNYKWGQRGGMNYSFSGNTFGDITLIRSFPFSLSSRLNKLSKFADAVTTKIWQNILDDQAGKIPLETKYLGRVNLNTLSGIYNVAQYSKQPSLSIFTMAETRSYKTMYRFIHRTMSNEQLNEIANGTFVFPFDKKVASRALLTEEQFVAIMLEEAIRSEGYGN